MAILTVSDFGRTLTPNARGTDHAWGGNMIVMGGSVAGGQVLGSFPSTFDEASNEQLLSKGRLVPTMPWEAMWNAVGEWVGVEEGIMQSTVLPNHANFGAEALLTKAQLFEA